jgi:hypothetical protein
VPGDRPLIEALKPTAKQNETGALSPRLNLILAEGLAPRARINQRSSEPVDAVDRRGCHIRTKNEASASPGRLVVNLTVPAKAEAAQIHGLQRPEASLTGPFKD